MLLVVFITGCKKDNDPGIRPKVTSTNPVSSAIGTIVNSKIAATFSVAMDPATINPSTFTLQKAGANVAGTTTYSGTTATFSPTADLSPSTIYTATITTDAADMNGKTLVKAYTWTFTSSANADVILPTVTLTDPANNATAVGLDKLIVATFSEQMDPASITAFTFAVKQGTTSVAGAVTYTGTTATFTPTNKLEPNKIYTVTISTGAKDKAANALASNYTFNFTTGDGADTAPPTVSLTDPLDNTTSVAQNKAVKITFNETMDPATISTSTITLKQGTTVVAGAVVYAAMTATFTPTVSLATGLVYTATVTTGAKDAAGNALAANTVWSFTTIGTADITLPMVNATDPLNNATGVDLSKIVKATFNEAMNPSTINATTFTLKQGATVVAGSVTYAGTTASFTPTTPLTANLIYTGTITTGVKDLAGNALAANVVWNFTTSGTPDTILPTVSVTDPLNNATSVPQNNTVKVTFSEAMDPLTINILTFNLKKGTAAVSGSVTYSGTTATFTPASNMTANTSYTATISTGAKDLAGNALATSMVWSFTTSGSSLTLAPVSLGAAGNYVILAKTAINNIPTSAITGDLGLSPAATSYITGFALTNATGFATSPQVTGSIYAADMASPTSTNLTTAVNNMITAYNDAAGRPSPDFSELSTGNIGGKILTPGLYKWTNTVTMPASLTISGGANDVWIFQISGDLTMSNGVNITLTGGAQPKNIFWQVAGTVTIGTTAHFEGIILSMTGITFQTGASMNGRALAQTAVILDANAITKPAN